MIRRLPIVALVPILLVAAYFRFSGLHWDANVRQVEGQAPVLEEQHLHPDERFLTMVTSALEYPQTIGQYFDTAVSPMNPHNRGHRFFAYGTLPLFMVRVVSGWLDAAGYDNIHIVGRVFSGAAGLVTVALLYLFGRRLYGPGAGLLAAFLYAVAALPIEQAHFCTVDEFANPFVMLALLAAVSVQEHGSRRAYLGFGAALGAAMACKMPVFTLALVLVAAAVSRFTDTQPADAPRRRLDLARSTAQWLVLAGALAFVVFRLFQPYAFAGPGLFGLSISPDWWANMKEVRELVSGARDYPPGHQWADRPAIWFPWKNMVTVGLGPALGLAGWAGWAWAGWELWRRRERRHLVPWIWVAIVFLHQGTQWVKSMRYLLPIYPMMALFAAWLVVRLWRGHATEREALLRSAWKRRAAAILGLVLVAGSAAWAWAFTSIYRRPHSRIAASHWIYANVEPGKKIGVEVWDDPLPLRIEGRDAFAIYKGVEIHGYAEDAPSKLDHLITALDDADVVSLSSNRLYDSIPRLPMRYPMMVRYYQLLFSGELGFRRAAEFTSYPRLFGIDFPDQSAEEAWSVYDHPRVQLFEKTAAWDAEKARHLLSDGIDWDGIQRLWPRDIASYKTLVMDPALAREQYSGGTWSRSVGGMFGDDGLAARHPALVWVLALLLLGGVGFLLTFVALPGLVDRGFLISRAVGLLAVTYVAWLLASLRWVAFTRGGVAFAGALVLALAASAAWSARRELRAFVAERWRLLVVEEMVFWLFFAVLLAIRAANPDLWHAARGGEKPMDLAYLTAVTKSTWFPPYDPWFAGGYMNYYYFGFVLTAALIKLSGVAPDIAYNLAVPTFYALMAGGAFTAAGALAARLRRAIASPADDDTQPPVGVTFGSTRALLGAGLLGAIFVAVAGNLAEVRLVLRGFRELGGAAAGSTLSGVAGLQSLAKGVGKWAGGQRFTFPDDWWFWSASRAIEHPPGEAPPITEFPFFTYLFADLHAHLMALPIALLVLVALVALVVDDRATELEARRAWSPRSRPRDRPARWPRSDPARARGGCVVADQRVGLPDLPHAHRHRAGHRRSAAARPLERLGGGRRRGQAGRGRGPRAFLLPSFFESLRHRVQPAGDLARRAHAVRRLPHRARVLPVLPGLVPGDATRRRSRGAGPGAGRARAPAVAESTRPLRSASRSLRRAPPSHRHDGARRDRARHRAGALPPHRRGTGGRGAGAGRDRSLRLSAPRRRGALHGRDGGARRRARAHRGASGAGRRHRAHEHRVQVVPPDLDAVGGGGRGGRRRAVDPSPSLQDLGGRGGRPARRRDALPDPRHSGPYSRSLRPRRRHRARWRALPRSGGLPRCAGQDSVARRRGGDRLAAPIGGRKPGGARSQRAALPLGQPRQRVHRAAHRAGLGLAPTPAAQRAP